MMYQAFWFGVNLEDLLFHGFSIHSVGGLIWLCLGLFVLSVSFEGLKVLQIKAKVQSLLLGKTSSFTGISDDTELFSNTGYASRGRKFGWFVAEVGLYVVQIISGYMIMLVVMTYNAYIGFSVLFGASIGYAVFGAVLMTHRMQNAKLATPCQQCINTPRDDSPQTTILEDDAGCCSTVNEEDPALSPIVHTSSVIRKKFIRSSAELSGSADRHACHHENTTQNVDEETLLTPD